MVAILLKTQEDIDWLFETHLKSIEDFEWAKTNCKAFILVGNEDSPDLVELYNHNPCLGDKPYFIKKFLEGGFLSDLEKASEEMYKEGE